MGGGAARDDALLIASAGLFATSVLLSKWRLSAAGGGSGGDDDDENTSDGGSRFCRVCRGLFHVGVRRHYHGIPVADSAMSSSGTVFVAPAVGGAIAAIVDPAVLAAADTGVDDVLASYYMRRRQDRLSFHEVPEYEEGPHSVDYELSDDPRSGGGGGGDFVNDADADIDDEVCENDGESGVLRISKRRSNWSHFDLPDLSDCNPNSLDCPLPYRMPPGLTAMPPTSSRTRRRRVSLEGDLMSDGGPSSTSQSQLSSRGVVEVQDQQLAAGKRRQHAETSGNGGLIPGNNYPSSGSLPTIPAEMEMVPGGMPDSGRRSSAPRSSGHNHHRQQDASTPFFANPAWRKAYVRAESLDDRTFLCHEERQELGQQSITSKRAGYRDDTGKPLASAPPLSAPPKLPKPQSSSMSRSLSQPNLQSGHEADDGSNGFGLKSDSIRMYDRSLSALVRRQNLAARAHYNARIMPDKLVLVRHGQSAGNIDERLYQTVPDNAMPLTKLGWEQARVAGRNLKENVLKNPANVHFIVSPYVRSVETFHGMASAWCDPAEFKHIPDRDLRLKAWYSRLLQLGITWHEDPRIREQDFGNYQDSQQIKEAKKHRHAFGAFYYRFPNGESASDVFDRISTFLDSLWRSFDMKDSKNYVLVMHGISMRTLLTRYFRYTIDQFHLMSNPKNCECIELAHDGLGRLELFGRYELEIREDERAKEPRVIGIRFHKRLRVLPPHQIRRVHIRMSYED